MNNIYKQHIDGYGDMVNFNKTR